MAKDNSRLSSLLSESSRAAGFTNGYVAGNIQFGSSIVESHISNLKHNFEQLLSVANINNRELISSSIQLLNTANSVRIDNPLMTLSYIVKSLTNFSIILDGINFTENPDYKSISKRIIYHYLSLAKQIKDAGLTNLAVELGEKNQKKILAHAG